MNAPVLLPVLEITPMRVECAWCRAVMRAGREPVSHGICEKCAERVFALVGSNNQLEARAV